MFGRSSRLRQTPLVSVLIPAHNAAATLATSLGSIQRQSWSKLEIIVIDDGSSDRTPALLAEIGRADSRVRILCQARSGIAAALNAGLRAAAGDYVARMDADDISLPWRVARQVEFMEQNPEVAASGTNVLPFGLKPFRLGAPSRMPTDAVGIATRLLFNPPIMHPTAIIRRSIVRDGELYAPAMFHAQDFELWSRLSRAHRLSNIPEVCLLYRRAPGAVSQRHREDQQSRANEIRLANLVDRCGAEFAARHAASHLEMMMRRFGNPAPAEHMPAYVRDLLLVPGLSRALIERTWLSYCVDYARAGGDGESLFVAGGQRAGLFRSALLRGAARFRRR